MRPGFSKKFVTIVFFTIVTIVLEYIAEKAGVASRLGSYSEMHSVLLDFAALVVLLRMWKDYIKKEYIWDKNLDLHKTQTIDSAMQV